VSILLGNNPTTLMYSQSEDPEEDEAVDTGAATAGVEDEASAPMSTI
jgi:hypothetical protein